MFASFLLRTWRRFWLAVLLLACVAVTAVRAHGGGEIQLANVPVGPYQMTVWLNPPRPRAAEAIHVTVALADPPDDSPVLDATITIQVWRLSDPPELALTAPATTAASANKLFYEADFVGAEAGDYEAVILVSGPDGDGDAAFPLQLLPASPINGFSLGLLLLGLVGVGVLIRHQMRARKSQ